MSRNMGWASASNSLATTDVVRFCRKCNAKILADAPEGLCTACLFETGLNLLAGTPVLDLKPYVPLFDAPADDVRAGWFEGRAERVFERRSDDRFFPRSRR